MPRRAERAQRVDRTPELGVDRAHERRHAVPGGVAQGIALLLHHHDGDRDGKRHHRRRRRDRQDEQVGTKFHRMAAL
jgi:hypothetical protein